MMGPSEFGRTNPEGVCEKRKTRDSLKLGKGMIWGVSLLRLNQLSKNRRPLAEGLGDTSRSEVTGLILSLNGYRILEERGNCDGTSRLCTTSPRGVLQKGWKWGSLKLEKGLFLGASLLRLKIAFDNNRPFAKSSGLTLILSGNCLWRDSGEHREVCKSESAQIRQEGKDFSVLRRDDVRIRQNEHQVHTSFWDKEKILPIRRQNCSWLRMIELCIYVKISPLST